MAEKEASEANMIEFSAYMDDLLKVKEFRQALMMERNAFEGISCHKLAFGPNWFADAWLHHWLPTSDVSANLTNIAGGGEVLAMISHCKELREIGVVLEESKKVMADETFFYHHWVRYTVAERDNLQSQWDACEELQDQKMPKLRVWEVDGNKRNLNGRDESRSEQQP